MWTLVRKDLILDRRMVGLNFAIYLVMGPVFLTLLDEAPVGLIAGWAGLVGAMIPLSLVAREDKFKTAPLTCSLPVTRDAVVQARYVGGWILALGGALAVLTACYGATLAGLAHPSGSWAGGFLIAFLIVGLFMAGLVPFTMRFGFAGLIGFLVAAQVLGIVLFLSAALLGAHGSVGTVIRGAVGAVQSLRETFGPPGLAALLAAATIVLNGVSFILSRWICRRRNF
jgi:hypothetical protein